MPSQADPAAATRFEHGGVTVAWEPAALLLRMVHGPDLHLSDATAWTLGKRMGAWIQGLEGRVGVLVVARGVEVLPEDWQAYWIKVLHKGFVKGFAVLGASQGFERTAASIARLTGVPFAAVASEEEARAFLDGLPPRPYGAPPVERATTL